MSPLPAASKQTSVNDPPCVPEFSVSRQQFDTYIDGVTAANAIEHIGEPALRVDPIEIRRFEQAVAAAARSLS